MLKTAIIGAGTMGGALYEGMQRGGKVEDVILCDRTEDKLAATADAECIVLAIKPQAFSAVMQEVGRAWESKLVVSIMAGISIARLADTTGSPRIIRSMPNLGAKIGRSVTGWCVSDQVTDTDRAHAVSVFQGIGLSIELDAEDKIDAFTAIAGSGPAYVFGLAELLQQSAGQLGLSDDQAVAIATEVVAASSQLLCEGGMSAREWREAVTSKGGVTEAAVQVLRERNMADIFQQAIAAGAARSKILSSEA